MSRLQHDSIVKAYALEDELDEGVKGVAMILELCRGSTLNRWLPWHDRDRVVLDVACRRQCLTQIASAIAYLHSVRIAHRDLHSKNVVMHASQTSGRYESASVQVKVIDLGCARDIDSDEAMEAAGLQFSASQKLARILTGHGRSCDAALIHAVPISCASQSVP